MAPGARLTAAALVVAAGWGSAALMLDRAGAVAAEGHYDVVVVLGCRPKADGSISWCLERRTGAAVRAWRAGRADRVVITGGTEADGPSEASVAAAFARTLGVPRDLLVVGETAASTRGNALEVLALVGPVSALLSTDQSHCWRATRTFRAVLPDVGCQPVVLPWTSRAWMALREVVASAWYAARGWL